MKERKDFFEKIASLVLSSEKNTAFIIVKIKQFKEINTTYGFSKGDRFLEVVEETLNAILREGDVVGRIGDNEFGVLLTGLNNTSHAVLAANKISTAFKQTIDIEGARISPKIVMGVAAKPEHGNTLDELLHAATLALQAAEKNNDDYRLY